MERIKFKGLENLTQEEQKEVQEISKKYLEKIGRRVKIKSIEIQVKEYRTEGKNKKSSIRIIANLEVRKFESDSEGWKLNQTLKSGFEKILTEIEHEFHI